MNHTMTVLIVEDDPQACDKFLCYVKDYADITIVDICDNSDAAIAGIVRYSPDAVILDLELNQGGGTGIDVLCGLKQLHHTRKPYILVTTQNTSEVTHHIARQKGADFIITKYQTGYSEKSALTFLQNIASIICNRHTAPASAITKHTSHNNIRIKQCVNLELNLVGISPKVLGFTYLTDAIVTLINSPDADVYKIISSRYNKSESSVIRAMQNAIDKAWRTSSVEDLYRYYTARISPEKGNPTVTEFIHYYYNKLSGE